MKKMMLVAVCIMTLATPAKAERNNGHGFFGIGMARNSSGNAVDVHQPVLPQLAIECGYPMGKDFSAGFEISALFYTNRTQRWGSEFGFGAALGVMTSYRVSGRWFLTAGGGWTFSNPLSDGASGEYMAGYEGNSAAQIVREPVQHPYVRFTVGRRLSDRWAVQAGTRNLSPFIAIGFAPVR